MASSVLLRVIPRTIHEQLLVLMLLLLIHLTPASSQGFPVTVSRVSGCMDVGMSTDNCTGGSIVTIYGSNFNLVNSSLTDTPSILGMIVSFYPDDYLSIYERPGFFSLRSLNYTNSTITARLNYPYPVPALNYQWQNVTVGTGTWPNVSDPLVAGLRYATQQPPYIVQAACPNSEYNFYSYCTSYSTLFFYGYYLNNVTSIAVSASVQADSGQTVQLFNVSCGNFSLANKSSSKYIGTYYTLGCQLPLLSYTNPPTVSKYYYPTLLVTLVSPYGSRSTGWLMLNTTYNSASACSAAASTTLALLLLLLVVTLAV